MVATLAINFLYEGKAVHEFVEDECGAVAILNTRRVDLGAEEHAQRMALAPLILPAS